MSSDHEVSSLTLPLCGNPAVNEVFDALEAKGVKGVLGLFRYEDGSDFIELWSLCDEDHGGPRRLPMSLAMEKRIECHVYRIGGFIAEGLQLSFPDLGESWIEVVASVWIDVKARCVRVYNIREVYNADIDWNAIVVL